MGNIQGLVPERSIHIDNEFWIVDNSTMELPVMTDAILRASLIMILILLIMNWML